ncbi:penicillin-binding transpeptidase domain-containing protein [Pasteuria penetrans]|uniref:penicillin-binding transpeptidase domain-containing protein n=1 Tax=Pasteuria penetrans TaxID=86005 RepID=UPI00165B84AA|nr:penicillin-binding transpeptidase domain-containing protein [Pasteuria penetrans]
MERVPAGSAIKPLTVFTPAIQEGGYNEYSLVPDRPIRLGDWEPRNFNGECEDDDVTMREVVAQSLNLPSVWLLKEVVGLDKAMNYALRLGLPLLPPDRNYAPLALGGLSRGVHAGELAQAYSVYPNHGSYLPMHAVVSLRDRAGAEIQPLDFPQKLISVFQPKAAYYMTRMMEAVVRYGTANSVRLKRNRPVAGKTGTSQNGEVAWFVGFTPDRVLAVNVFYPQRQAVISMHGSEIPTRLFSAVLDGVMATPPQSFRPPPGISPPAPPFDLQTPTVRLVAEGDWVRLHWPAQPERVVFAIYRAAVGGKFEKIAQTRANVTTYQDLPPPGDRAYSYRVAAIDVLESQTPPQFSDVYSVILPRSFSSPPIFSQPGGKLGRQGESGGDDEPKKSESGDDEPKKSESGDDEPKKSESRGDEPEEGESIKRDELKRKNPLAPSPDSKDPKGERDSVPIPLS